MFYLKEKIKNTPFLRPLIFRYRKLKLLFKGYFYMPKFVKTPLGNGNEIILETRNFATVRFCLDNLKGPILDYEPGQRKIFLDIIYNKKCFFDIGCQIGYYALIAAKLGVPKIVAIDINREFIEIARKQAKLNGVLNQIDFYQLAIGKDGEEIVVENYNNIDKTKSISLDFFCKTNNLFPDLIKLDIEGFELEALENAPNLLSQHKPVIILSFHPPFIKQRNRSPKEVIDILLKNSYEILKIENDGSLKNILKIEDILENLGEFLCIAKKR